MAQTYYAIGYGHKRGVYDSWGDVRRFTKGFPHPVYKKFTTKLAAEKYLEECKPQSISIDVDDVGDKFYALPRGKIIGIFKDFAEVRKNIAGFPKPLYKKFSSYKEAKEFYEKFSTVETQDFKSSAANFKTQSDDKEKEDETMDTSEPNEENNEMKEVESTSQTTNSIKQVARKRTAGYASTDESGTEDGKSKPAAEQKGSDQHRKIDGDKFETDGSERNQHKSDNEDSLNNTNTTTESNTSVTTMADNAKTASEGTSLNKILPPKGKAEKAGTELEKRSTDSSTSTALLSTDGMADSASDSPVKKSRVGSD